MVCPVHRPRSAPMAVQRHAGCHGTPGAGIQPPSSLPRPTPLMFPARFCVADRRGAITGRLLEDGTAVVVSEKDQEALAWADYHLAGERLPGVRGEAGAEHAAQEAAGTEPSDRQRVLAPGVTARNREGRDRRLTRGPGRLPTAPPNVAEPSSEAGARSAVLDGSPWSAWQPRTRPNGTLCATAGQATPVVRLRAFDGVQAPGTAGVHTPAATAVSEFLACHLATAMTSLSTPLPTSCGSAPGPMIVTCPVGLAQHTTALVTPSILASGSAA